MLTIVIRFMLVSCWNVAGFGTPRTLNNFARGIIPLPREFYVRPAPSDARVNALPMLRNL
jgi:hypothetical protein